MVRGDAEPRGQAWGPGAVPGAGAPAAEVAPSRGPLLELGILGTPAPPRSLLVHGTGGFGGARQPPLGGLMEQPHRLSGNRFPAWAPWPIKC